MLLGCDIYNTSDAFCISGLKSQILFMQSWLNNYILDKPKYASAVKSFESKTS